MEAYSVQVFYCLFISVMSLEIQLSRRGSCVCSKLGHRFLMPYILVFFLVFNYLSDTWLFFLLIMVELFTNSSFEYTCNCLFIFTCPAVVVILDFQSTKNKHSVKDHPREVPAKCDFNGSVVSHSNNYVSPLNDFFFRLHFFCFFSACTDHNFFVFHDRSIIFGMWVHDHKRCHIP